MTDAPAERRIGVLKSSAELTAYMSAYATGRYSAVLDGVRATHAEWNALAEDDGGTAWEYARRLDLPLVALDRFEGRPEALSLIPAATARALRAVPLQTARGCVIVAIDASTDAQALSALDFVTRERVAGCWKGASCTFPTFTRQAHVLTHSPRINRLRDRLAHTTSMSLTSRLNFNSL